QPPVPSVGPEENQHRFNRVFQAFSTVFARREHPLVLFLDDLQWADVPTLQLIRTIVTNPDSRHLLFIGSYRDNEVDEAHPLTTILGDIEKLALVSRITLAPLAPAEVVELVADTLRCDSGEAVELSGLVHAKTGGNPFFINMLLRSLHHDGLITFDVRDRAW